VFVTDVEVVQELLHRYLALHIWPEGRRSIEEFVELMRGRIEPMIVADVEMAARLADTHAQLSARDLVHASVMHRIGCSFVVTADKGFDEIGGIERLDPMRVDEWAHLVTDQA
jgi:predicted nucleic acid-binding protein